MNFPAGKMGKNQSVVWIFALTVGSFSTGLLSAATNIPSLSIESLDRLIVSNSAGWRYAVLHSTNLATSSWVAYPQTHQGRGAREAWAVQATNSATVNFYKATASNFVASIAATTDSVSILHYPDFSTGRVWNVALYMVNTAGVVTNNPLTPELEWYTPAQLGDLYFKHPMGANAFLKDASGGLEAFAGTVVGWIEQPEQNLSDTDVTSNPGYYFGLGDPYLRYADYALHVMHARVKNGGAQLGWLYPQQSFNSPQGNISGIGIDWMVNSSVFDLAPLDYSNWSSDDSILPTAPWIHEFLHTMGINGHANSYDCGTNIISQFTDANPIKAYGNPFSVMGERAFATHPDAAMKLKLDWITTNQIQTTITNGTYTIYPLELADGQTKALSVPINPPITNNHHGFAFDHFLIEYRRPIGFDRYLKRLDGSTFLSQYKPQGAVTNNGVLIYLEYPKSANTDATLLLDMHPTSSYNANRGIKILGNAGKFADAMLNVGETFTWNGTSITPIGTNAAGAMQVTITH